MKINQLAIYASLLTLGSGVGFLGHSYVNMQQRTTSQSQLIPTVNKSYSLPINQDPADLNFVAKAVQKVGPAVVRIDASRYVSPETNNPLDPLRRFFGEESPNPEKALERGTGSGFILSPDGILLTNAHVIDGANKVTVTLKNGQSFEGKVMGVDTLTDIAIVKIEASNLPTVNLGNSANLIPGEWAIAIGNPLGLDNTVTVGIVSALGRSSTEVGIPDKRVKYIQTDAAINPGNSGGPLLNAQGDVIGMNTAIRANAQGLGFAIPIETIEKVVQELYTYGEAQHPYLGIQMMNIDANTLETIRSEFGLNLDQETGVLIVQVVPNSPAQQAGLVPGDILKKVGDQPIATSSDVQEIVEGSQIGEILEVQVKREQELKTIQVRPGSFPQEEAPELPNP
ncbi:HhoA/HhoB/HtrA family serine endopeptidase [Gloeocapsa sp. PCC 73106]|uniref:HhoA/HhoB/HtrA family serine endopeptidase n=1 Tax=Gloeocapsa sp. PCC 73106 TaxID=102232 RepID=UPI0002ABBAB5|nr:HhoA/HhoB/HtrA family serine endopeptidase [Gloeocapsa sp. PCC 73106]ELS00110.1 trypsin-like serine protease with C-terminal PDZ domain [Gloeocapsa sp. PCC 73106]